MSRRLYLGESAGFQQEYLIVAYNRALVTHSSKPRRRAIIRNEPLTGRGQYRLEIRGINEVLVELDRRVVQFTTARFPGYGTIIERMYKRDSTFRELCRDYKRCDDTLEGWRRRDGASSAERLREYAELLSELRDEIEDWLGGGQGFPEKRRDK
jgi:hypothetical protein